MPLALRRRLLAAIGLVLTCLSGTALRMLTEGAVAKLGGDLLYAVAVYALVLVIRPATSARAVAGVAAAVCWLVEFAQLTPFPAEASRHSILSRLVLGSTFHPLDLVSYLLGVLLAWGLAWTFVERTGPQAMTMDPPGDPASQHPWQIIYEGYQRQARHAGGLGDEARQIWITWLRRFDIDPDDVLLDPFFLVAEDDHRTIRYLGVVRDEHGKPLLRGTQLERCVVTVQLEAPAPPFPGER